jgi:hypothetical protein
MDPEVKKYFVKILYSLSLGLFWMALNVTTGIYWEMATINNGLSLMNVLFFLLLLISLALLLYYYYRTWRTPVN